MNNLSMLALVIASFLAIGADYASAASGCHRQTSKTAAAQPATPVPPVVATAPAGTGRRTFSVQPGTEPVYRAPATRSYRTYGPTNPSWDAGRKIRGQY